MLTVQCSPSSLCRSVLTQTHKQLPSVVCINTENKTPHRSRSDTLYNYIIIIYNAHENKVWNGVCRLTLVSRTVACSLNDNIPYTTRCRVEVDNLASNILTCRSRSRIWLTICWLSSNIIRVQQSSIETIQCMVWVDCRLTQVRVTIHEYLRDFEHLATNCCRLQIFKCDERASAHAKIKFAVKKCK